MSDTVVFIIGAFVFAITVYGTIMAGGIALTRRQIEEEPELGDRVDSDELNKTVPLKVEY